MIVPFRESAGSSISNLPPLIWRWVPTLVAQVIKSTSDTEAIDGKASPRNPRVSIKNKEYFMNKWKNYLAD